MAQRNPLAFLAHFGRMPAGHAKVFPRWITGGDEIRLAKGDRAMDATRMTADLTVEDVLQVWPETLRVFLHRRMACVGCEVARFHTVAEAARIYDVPAEMLLRELREGAGATPIREGTASGATSHRQYAPARAGRGSRSAAVPP